MSPQKSPLEEVPNDKAAQVDTLADDELVAPLDAAAGLGLDEPQPSDFDYFSEVVYDEGEDKGEVNSLPPRDGVSDEKRDRDRLKIFAETGDISAVRRILEQVEYFDVPQWLERPRGDKRDSFQWIRDHFGRTSEGEWKPEGLTRSKLRQADFGLYQAFNTRVFRIQKSNKDVPEDMVPLLEAKSETIDERLEREGLKSADDVRKRYPDDHTEAERLISALRRRQP